MNAIDGGHNGRLAPLSKCGSAGAADGLRRSFDYGLFTGVSREILTDHGIILNIPLHSGLAIYTR